MTPDILPTASYDQQLTEKSARLQAMMSPFQAPAAEIFRSPAEHYRMRAEFRVWHDEDDLYHIMFDPQTKQRIRIEQFPVASLLINRLMSAMMATLRSGVDIAPRLKVLAIAEPKMRKAGIKVDSVATLVDKLKNEAGVL